jgi:hypothetical protein
MNDFSETDIGSLDLKNRAQIVRMTRRLLRADNVGILCTIDESGSPQARWMATMSLRIFPTYTPHLREESKSCPDPGEPGSPLGVFEPGFDPSSST